MTFSLPDHWVWDFWLADDGETFHMYYLHAPKALGDSHLRHRNARIGHATSRDLMEWQDHGEVFDVGASGSHDASATWTGSVVRGPDGLWRMFYTGARFLSEGAQANIESVGMATSPDLFNWTKSTEPVCVADPQWYEILGTSEWPEQAWRDPWVYFDPDDNQWHMLVTARSNHGAVWDRGVIGHAVSSDLETWKVQPPLSAPGKGFAHLEVPQIVQSGDRTTLIFCCDSPKLSGRLAGEVGGIWSVDITGHKADLPIETAVRLTDDQFYAGRIVTDRNGQHMLLAFEGEDASGHFVGRICDPVPISLDTASPSSALAMDLT